MCNHLISYIVTWVNTDFLPRGSRSRGSRHGRAANIPESVFLFLPIFRYFGKLAIHSRSIIQLPWIRDFLNFQDCDASTAVSADCEILRIYIVELNSTHFSASKYTMRIQTTKPTPKTIRTTMNIFASFLRSLCLALRVSLKLVESV